MNIVQSEFYGKEYVFDSHFIPQYDLPKNSGPDVNILLELHWCNQLSKESGSRSGYYCFTVDNERLGSVRKYLQEKHSLVPVSFYDPFGNPFSALNLETRLSDLPNVLTWKKGTRKAILLIRREETFKCPPTQFFVKITNSGGTERTEYRRYQIDTNCGHTIGKNCRKIAEMVGQQNSNYKFIVFFSLSKEYKVFSRNSRWGNGNDSPEGWGCNASCVYVLIEIVGE